MNPCSYICSLGPSPHAAFFLKHLGWKYSTYPFDWLSMTPDAILHCLRDDFAVFLDPSMYFYPSNRIERDWMDRPIRHCGHRLYGPHTFLFRDPHDEGDYNYFRICIDQFRHLLRYPETKLFLAIHRVHPDNDLLEKEKAMWVQMAEELERKTTEFTLLVVFHREGNERRRHTQGQQGRLHWIDLRTFSRSNGHMFEDELDNQYLASVITSLYTFQCMPFYY